MFTFRKDLQEKFTGWSGISCSTCGKEITHAALKFSNEHYRKPLCKYCQGLEKYAPSEKGGVAKKTNSKRPLHSQQVIEDAKQYAKTADKYGFAVPDFENDKELVEWYKWCLAHEP